MSPKKTGLLRAREDVQNDRLMRPQRTVTRLMRITALLAAGDDGVAGHSARLEDGGVDDGPEFFGGERSAVMDQSPVPGDSRRLERPDAFRHARLRHPQRRDDVSDFRRRFLFAFGKEGSGLGHRPDTEIVEFVGQAEGEIARHENRADPLFPEDAMDDTGEIRLPPAALEELLLEAGKTRARGNAAPAAAHGRSPDRSSRHNLCGGSGGR